MENMKLSDEFCDSRNPAAKSELLDTMVLFCDGFHGKFEVWFCA